MCIFCNSSASVFYTATHLIGEVCQISFLHFFLSAFYGQLFLISFLFYSLSFPSTYLNIVSFNYFTVLHLSCDFSRTYPSPWYCISFPWIRWTDRSLAAQHKGWWVLSPTLSFCIFSSSLYSMFLCSHSMRPKKERKHILTFEGSASCSGV